MSGYVKGLLAAVVICRLVLLLCPDFAEGMKKYMKYLAGLVILTVLLLPILNGCHGGEEIKDAVNSFLASAENQTETAANAENNAVVGAVRETAYAIMTHLVTEYGIPQQDITVTILTDEAEDRPSVEEIQIYIVNCAPAERARIRADIGEQTGISTFVFGREQAVPP